MSSEEKGWRRYVGPISISAIIMIGIFWYTNFYNVPKLTHEVLESYPLSDNEQITLIIFRNMGRSPATNLVINIESKGIIQNYTLSSPEEIDAITIAPNKLRFKMARLVHNVKVLIYIRTLMQLSSPFNEITMMSDQGTGNAYIIQKSLFPGYIEVGVLISASIITIITFIALRKDLEQIIPERVSRQKDTVINEKTTVEVTQIVTEPPADVNEIDLPEPSFPSDRWEFLWFRYIEARENSWGEFITRTYESELNFDYDWKDGIVNNSGLSNNVALKASRTLRLDAGRYTFLIGADDGIRLYVYNNDFTETYVERDEWRDQEWSKFRSLPVDLPAGDYMILIEWYEHYGAARASFTLHEDENIKRKRLQLRAGTVGLNPRIEADQNIILILEILDTRPRHVEKINGPELLALMKDEGDNTLQSYHVKDAVPILREENMVNVFSSMNQPTQEYGFDQVWITPSGRNYLKRRNLRA